MRHRATLIATLMFIAALISSCAWSGIKGTVVDAETGAPIEGAAVVATWNISGGLGPGKTAVIETLTDSDGRFNLEPDGLVSTPTHFVIYKYGYLAWSYNTRMISTEGYRKIIPGFKWRSGQTYKLEKFPEGWSHDNHIDFITESLGHVYSPLIHKASDKELDEAAAERQKIRDEEKLKRMQNEKSK